MSTEVELSCWMRPEVVVRLLDIQGAPAAAAGDHVAMSHLVIEMLAEEDL